MYGGEISDGKLSKELKHAAADFFWGKSTPAAGIFGCAGKNLTPEEITFFKKLNPFGFILFARNCDSPAQLRALVTQLQDALGRKPLIFIDQEGGRVARLKPPHWRAVPAAARITALRKTDFFAAQQAVYWNARLIAAELADLGIHADCAPLADVPAPGSHDIIGDRAFSDDPMEVSILAREQSRGLLDGGVLPVLKHIPGHGRALVDSHESLPVVDSPLELLQRTDFIPFRALNDLPLGMTAHIVYNALDSKAPATLSPKVINYIRTEIGFDGMLMSDDLSMKALKADFGTLTRQTLKSGCDLVLHCNGKMDEMQTIADAIEPLSKPAQRRAEQALNYLHTPLTFNQEEAMEAVERVTKHAGKLAV